jgi:hypothetical protein
MKKREMGRTGKEIRDGIFVTLSISSKRLGFK